MKKIFSFTIAALLLSAVAPAQQHEADHLPKPVLDKSECVIVIPSVKKFAIGVGGNYGRGAMTCRGGQNFTGPWGPPAMVALEGGNIGFQLGGQATDFVLLVVN